MPAVPVPHAPTRNPSGSHLVVRHLSAKGLALDGLVTPERLLSALAYELRSGCHTAEGTPRPCTQMTVLVDGKNWHPGGIFGYTLAAIPSRWIRRVDVLENAPADPPPGGEAATSGDPSVVDVILHRFLFSGEASVAAGVDEGGGAFSGGNAEDYNILLNAQDRNGDSFLLDFNYERFYGPVWYGYPPGAIVVPNTVYPGPDSFQETPGSGTPFGGRMRPPPSKQDPSGGGRFIWQHPLPR